MADWDLSLEGMSALVVGYQEETCELLILAIASVTTRRAW
jgi:hypothetical protein